MRTKNCVIYTPYSLWDNISPYQYENNLSHLYADHRIKSLNFQTCSSTIKLLGLALCRCECLLLSVKYFLVSHGNYKLNIKFLVQSVDDEEEDNNKKIAPALYQVDESDNYASEDSMEVDTVEDGEEPLLYSDISDDEEDGEISD